MNKKDIFYIILFVILSALSISLVGKLSGFAPAELMNQLQSADGMWLIGAVILTCGFVFFEGMALRTLVGELSNTGRNRGMLYASADIYFSAITPSATGGQPASAYFMVKDGVNAAITTVILLANLVMYLISLLICGFFSIIFESNLFYGYEIIAKTIIIIAICILMACISFFVMMLRHTEPVGRFFKLLIGLGTRLKIFRHPEKKYKKLESMLEQYEACSSGLMGHRRMLVKVFIYNILQRLSRGGVFICCHLALGGRYTNALKVWAVSTYASLGANLIPIPGGIGMTDYLLIKGFEEISDISNVANMTLLSRGVSFYVAVMISVVILTCGYFGKNNSENLEG